MTVPMLNRVKNGFTYSGETDLAVITCPTCGITYAIPERLRDEAQRRGESRIQWYCPNGHKLGFHGKSEEDKLRERVGQERRRSGRLAAERDQAEAEALGQRRAKTRFKNERDRERRRAAAGICPCCNRSFRQLKRHMASQHPDFLADA